jgi:hypothetical protein
MSKSRNRNAERKIALALQRGWTPDAEVGPCRWIKRKRRRHYRLTAIMERGVRQ